MKIIKLSPDKTSKNKIFNQNLSFKNKYGDKIRKKLMRKIKKSKEKNKENEKEHEENIKDIKIVNSIPAIIQKEKSVTSNTIENNHNKIQKNLFNKKTETQDYLAEKRKKLKPILNNIYANDIKKYLQKSGITENSLMMSKYKLDFLKDGKIVGKRCLGSDSRTAVCVFSKEGELLREFCDSEYNVRTGGASLSCVRETQRWMDEPLLQSVTRRDPFILVSERTALFRDGYPDGVLRRL